MHEFVRRSTGDGDSATGAARVDGDARAEMTAGMPDQPSPARQRPPSIGEPNWEPLERFLDLLHSTREATDLVAGDFMWMGYASGNRLPSLQLYKHRDTRKTFGIDAAGHAWRQPHELGCHVYRSPIDAAADLRDGWVPHPNGSLQPPGRPTNRPQSENWSLDRGTVTSSEGIER